MSDAALTAGTNHGHFASFGLIPCISVGIAAGTGSVGIAAGTGDGHSELFMQAEFFARQQHYTVISI